MNLWLMTNIALPASRRMGKTINPDWGYARLELIIHTYWHSHAKISAFSKYHLLPQVQKFAELPQLQWEFSVIVAQSPTILQPLTRPYLSHRRRRL